MKEFNLRGLVRQVCDETDATAPAELAALVLARIDSADHAEALRQALPAVVGSVVSMDRMRDHGRGASVVPTTNPATPGTSWKVTALQEHWRAQLRARIRVGEHSWAMLGDCTAEHLTFAAEHRDELARRNAARAEQLRDLGKELDHHGVATVAELPNDVLARHLGDTTRTV